MTGADVPEPSAVALATEAATRGVPLVLDVLTVNPRAYALYRRLGFREIGRYGEGNIKIRMRLDPHPPLCRS